MDFKAVQLEGIEEHIMLIYYSILNLSGKVIDL